MSQPNYYYYTLPNGKIAYNRKEAKQMLGIGSSQFKRMRADGRINREIIEVTNPCSHAATQNYYGYTN